MITFKQFLEEGTPAEAVEQIFISSPFSDEQTEELKVMRPFLLKCASALKANDVAAWPFSKGFGVDSGYETFQCSFTPSKTMFADDLKTFMRLLPAIVKHTTGDGWELSSRVFAYWGDSRGNGNRKKIEQFIDELGDAGTRQAIEIHLRRKP